MAGDFSICGRFGGPSSAIAACGLRFGEFKTPQIFIEFLRGRPRGGDKFSSPFKRSRPFIQSVKSTLLSLRVATPSGAPRQAPLEI